MRADGGVGLGSWRVRRRAARDGLGGRRRRQERHVGRIRRDARRRKRRRRDPPRLQPPRASSSSSRSAPAAPSTSPGGSGPLGFLSTASRSSNLLGDMWGVRPLLSKYGMTLSIIENSELFGNVSGGVRQGFENNGLTTATLQMDTQRAFGLERRPVQCQRLADSRRQSERLGISTPCRRRAASRPTAPSGFGNCGISRNSATRSTSRSASRASTRNSWSARTRSYFINTMFGWPMLPSADLPGGGPAYPLSALGVRARAHVTDTVTILAGVFNGSPVCEQYRRPATAQSQRRELPAQRRRACDRRTAIRLSRPGRRGEGERGGSARAHLQDRRLVRQRRLRRPALPTTPASRSPIPPATGFPQAIAAITPSTRSRTRCSGARRTPIATSTRSSGHVHAASGSQSHQLQPQRGPDDA